MSVSLTNGGLSRELGPELLREIGRGAQLQRHARALRRIAAGASLIAVLGIVPAAAQTAETAARKTVAHPASTHSTAAHPALGSAASHPHVYLMRGLLNIFSLGMDQLAAQVAHNGIDASVYNHSVEESVVATIVQKYRGGDHGPYILVGHSLGADAVMLMAQQLDAQGVPVALVVPFDGTASYAASANVSCVVNLTQRTYAYMQAGPGFHGRLSNVDVSSDTTIDHITIDKSPRLQAMALKEIMQAVHGQSCRPGQNGPAVARPKELNKGPQRIAPNENASKENASKESASTASPAKTAPAPNAAAMSAVKSAARSAPRSAPRSAVKSAAKSTAATKSAAPSAKNPAPAKTAAPEKSAAATSGAS